MKASHRWIVLIALLAAAATLHFADQPSQPAGAVVRDVPRSPTTPASPPTGYGEASATAAPDARILRIRPRTPAAEIVDSFAAHSWTPPLPPVRPVAPAPPTAPPLPFTVIGKKVEDGVWQVFLARRDQVFVVKASDALENTYRIDDIRPPLMTITYLPLGHRQTLAIGVPE